MAFSPKFDPLPTLEEEEELIALIDILRLRDGDLKIDEVWSICHQTCLALRSIKKTSPELFSQLCLNAETLAFNASGGVSFLHKDAVRDSFSPPECTEGECTMKGHIFSLGKTLLTSSVTVKRNGDDNAADDDPVSEYFHRMCSRDVDERPSVVEVINRCQSYLKDQDSSSSSKAVCSKLTAWGRRKLSLEVALSYDLTHLKELSSVSEDQSDCSSATTTSSSSSTGKDRKINTTKKVTDFKKRKRSLPKLPDDEATKIQSLNIKNKTERNKDTMDRSMLSPPNLDAFGNLSERAQEILRKIYDTSEQESSKKDTEEKNRETERKKEADRENDPKRKNNILIDKPHLLKRNSIASVGTSFSSQWLNRNETKKYGRTDKSNSEGNIKSSSMFDFKSSTSSCDSKASSTSVGIGRMYGISYHDDDKDISSLANDVNSRPSEQSSRGSSPSTSLSSMKHDLTEQRIEVDSDNPVDQGELLLPPDEDFILDDPWSEESDVDVAPIIKRKMRSHSIAIFNAPDPRSSAFRTPGQRRLSNASKGSRCSLDKQSVLSDSSQEPDRPLDENIGEGKYKHPNNTMKPKTGEGDYQRRHSHSFESSIAGRLPQEPSKRRNTMSDIGDVPSHFTSGATHFTPIIVAGENFVPTPSSKLISLQVDTKLKAKIAFEAIKKSSKKERPPKTMAADVENDAIINPEPPLIGTVEEAKTGQLDKINGKVLLESETLKTNNEREESDQPFIKRVDEQAKPEEAEVTNVEVEAEDSSSTSRADSKGNTSTTLVMSSSPSNKSEKQDKDPRHLTDIKDKRDGKPVVAKSFQPDAKLNLAPNGPTGIESPKVQMAKVTVVASSPLASGKMFSPIDKPTDTQNQLEIDVSLSSRSKVQSNNEAVEETEPPKAVVGGQDDVPNTAMPVISSAIPDQQPLAGVTSANEVTTATATSTVTSQPPSDVHQLQGDTVLSMGSTFAAPSQDSLLFAADGVGGVPLNVGPQVSPSQPSPGVFSMQVQFQQDPQTGLFRMIPVATPTFSSSPVVSSSPLLYSPGHPLASPSHSMSPLQVHSSPFYPVQASVNSPHRQVDTSSDPEYIHTHRSAAVPERKRDTHRRSNVTSCKKSTNSKRSERRQLSDSESSESSMFTPKSSGVNLERLQSKPGRLKTRSHSSANLEKPKKHPKRTSADPVLCQRDGIKLTNRSSDHSSKLSKPSKGANKGQPKTSLAAKTEDTRGRGHAAVSPGTVSSPSRDSGVHMRFSMSSGEEPSIATETQPEHPVMLQRVMRHIRHAFAFDGYLENGVEDLQMAEYITALAHLSWSTFSSAVTEKFCDLYWEEELLERLYEEINCRKVDKSKGKSTRGPSDSPNGNVKTSGKKPQAKSKKSPTVTESATPPTDRQSSPEKESTPQLKNMHTPRSNTSSLSTSRKLKHSTSQVADVSTRELTSNCAPDTESLSNSSQRRRNSSSSPRKEKGQDRERRQSHTSSADMKEGRNSSNGRRIFSGKQRGSNHHQQYQDKIPLEQRTDLSNDERIPSEERTNLYNDQKVPSEQRMDVSSDLKINEACSASSPDRDNSLDSKELCDVRKSKTTERSDEEWLRREAMVKKHDQTKELNLTLDKLEQSNDETSKAIYERKSLEGVEKCSGLVTDSASTWISSPTSKTPSSPSLGSLASLNTSLSLSESSHIQSPRKGDSDSSELSSTPTAYHVRQMLDCAITRSSSNASLNSFSSGNSSNQGLSTSGCLGTQGYRTSRKLQQVLMYGADAFQQDVVDYSRRLVGKSIEKKIKEVEQQISVEKKMQTKMERFYEKLKESQNNNNIKGADHKNKLSKVREQLDEMTSKMTLLDSVRCYLELTFAEQWGLDHSLLHSFAISQKHMHLQPHSENHMLQMKSGKNGISLLQAGNPQGLFTYLFAKGAVMEGYLYHFLYTFRYLSKRQTLLSFITEKFQAAECLPDGLHECRTQITLRTMDICHIWLEGFFEVDFRPDPELMAEMISFISDKLVNVNQQGQALLQLIDRKDKQDDVISDKAKENTLDDWSRNLPRQNHSAPAHWLSRKDNKDKLSVGGIIACFSKRTSKNQDSAYLPVMSLKKDGFALSEHTSNSLAEQLTLIQQSLFLKVHPVHYLNSRHKGIGVQTMTSKSTNEDLDLTNSLFSESIPEGGITELLDHSRMVSHWVSSEVVSCSSQKAQLALISKFINIAKSCYDMRNFATCIQVMDGLNNLIVRQVPAWKNIPSKVVLIFEELEAAGVLLKGDGDFLTRGNQHKTLTTLPCVHLVLMHIQQLEIGSFKLANGMYKWPKLKAIAECVDQIRVFQQHRYTLNSDEVLQGLLKARMEEFRPSEIQILAASNSANFHQFSSDKGSRKFQSALQKVKANLH